MSSSTAESNEATGAFTSFNSSSSLPSSLQALPRLYFALTIGSSVCAIAGTMNRINRKREASRNIDGPSLDCLIHGTTKLTERRHCAIHLQTPYASLRVQRMIRWSFVTERSNHCPSLLINHTEHAVTRQIRRASDITFSLVSYISRLLNRPRISHGVKDNREKHKRRESGFCFTKLFAQCVCICLNENQKSISQIACFAKVGLTFRFGSLPRIVLVIRSGW